MFWKFCSTTPAFVNCVLKNGFETNKQETTKTRNQTPIHIKPFYFQVRESPAPLIIPTPTPAHDRSGPAACLSCPEAVINDIRYI